MTAQSKPTLKQGRSDAQPDSPQDLAVAQRVLGVEADGLKALATSLDRSIVAALDLLAGVK